MPRHIVFNKNLLKISIGIFYHGIVEQGWEITVQSKIGARIVPIIKHFESRS